MSRSRSALSVSVNQLASELIRGGHDVTLLSLGEAFFQLPLFDFRSLDWESGFHYSDARGIPELRRAISEMYLERYGVSFDPESEILVTSGSKIAVFMAIKARLSTGGRVALFEPAWVSYKEQVLLAGGSPDFYSFAESFSGDLRFRDGTDIVVLNNPNNPSGRSYSARELDRIRHACLQVGADLVVDEAYSDFVPEGTFYSALNLPPASNSSTVVVNSLSKNLGMSGWRLGYLIGSPETIDSVLPLQQHLVTCAPTILQQYVARYLHEIYERTEPQIHEMVERRKALCAQLDKLQIEYLDGDSTFYVFVRAKSFGVEEQVAKFCLFLLFTENIALVPGVAYGENTETYLRISVGAEPIERIRDALYVVMAAAKERWQDVDLHSLANGLGLSNSGWSDWVD